jgi:hypothetical protein
MSERDFERLFTLDGTPGPARAIDARAEAAIVVAALAGAGFAPIGPGGGGGSGGGAAGAAGGSGAKLVLLLGGAALTAAAIATWIAVRHRHEAVIDVGSRAPAPPTVVIAPPAPAPAAPEAPAPDREPVVLPPVVVHGSVPAPAPAPHAHHVEPAPTPVPVAPPVAAPVPAPADLLAEANAARGAKQWTRADALYAQVAAMPDRLAAETALVADGQLRLEHLGDARGAASRFKAALASDPRGALAEDARWGLAEAARANGDARAEAAALDDFLAHHADSPLADRARARRKELGAP